MNKDLLEGLCKVYGFSWTILGIYIKIVSKRGTYYILNLDHEGRQIKLYHQNIYNNSAMHKHGKHKDLENVFRSIKSHDEIYLPGHRNNKFERIIDICNRLPEVYA